MLPCVAHYQQGVAKCFQISKTYHWKATHSDRFSVLLIRTSVAVAGDWQLVGRGGRLITSQLASRYTSASVLYTAIARSEWSVTPEWWDILAGIPLLSRVTVHTSLSSWWRGQASGLLCSPPSTSYEALIWSCCWIPAVPGITHICPTFRQQLCLPCNPLKHQQTYICWNNMSRDTAPNLPTVALPAFSCCVHCTEDNGEVLVLICPKATLRQISFWQHK